MLFMLRPLRLASGVALLAFLGLLLHFLRNSSSRGFHLRGDFKEPNLQLIDEPPEPLRRVNGDNYAPENDVSDRVAATFLSLVRNSELDDMLVSMRSLESTFNHKFNYPWTFFNDEDFTPAFQAAVRSATNATVNFYRIPAEHWAQPPWINNDLYAESVVLMQEHGVQYAGQKSYHQMFRWNSGLFARHKALENIKWYWRVDPNVRFFCSIDYDVFRFMADHNKTYGFSVALHDHPATIPSLWPETQRFLSAPQYKQLIHPKGAGVPWITDSSHRPELNKQTGGYSACHFWSNFEIADLDFWRGEAFMRYFDHLDRAGGFFYERWGDAPVHSIALAMFEDKSKIHWFRDIGYQHTPFFNCPTRPQGKCSGCKPGLLTDGEQWLVKEDCRASWFDHAGLGEWENIETSNPP